jgi:hypothetical protein
VSAAIDERMQLANEVVSQITLDSEGAVALPLGSLAGVNLIVLKVAGEPVTVSITSSEGTSQVIPVDTFFTLYSRSVDITAIEVTRTPGALTLVKYFLGEKA